MVHTRRRTLLTAIICVGTVACAGSDRADQDVDLSPASWAAGELETFQRLQETYGEAAPQLETDSAMIAGITAALAVRSGYEALRQGGSAADAALTTTFAEIVLTAGSSVTYAGEMVMLYYEAEAGRVHSMSATFNTLLGEDDPMSIPPQGTPSGRATLVPGVMAGLGAAHERFGRLPWAALVGPAVHFAEEGFRVDSRRQALIDARFEPITRFPEGRAIFLKEDGAPYREGDWFRQPALGATLRRVAAEGADYFYTGDWAHRLVEMVQREGGRMTLEDLSAYEVEWSDAAHAPFRGFDVYGPALPSYGGVNLLEALELADRAGLGDGPLPDESPETLYAMLTIAQMADMLSPPLIGSFPPAELLRAGLPDADLSAAGRLSDSTADRIWAAVETDGWPDFVQRLALARSGDSEAVENLVAGFGRRQAATDSSESEPPRHTAGIVVFDSRGDVAVLLHSINSSHWGDTGLFVDGVSIPDAGAFQQELIAAVGPGNRVPEWDTPTIVLRDGSPFLGSVSIGAAYHEVNVQNVLHVLAWGLDPGAALDRPQIRKKWPYHLPLRQPTGPGEFDRGLLEAVRALGMDLQIPEDPAGVGFGGYWAGIRVDPGTGRLQGARSRPQNGRVLGY
ncbi:MAG: gamma-glutamyltransferase [Gemmatimonadota bacterium]|nr:gamma-glutamyltransferase [Gemmatimonadota bacterium]